MLIDAIISTGLALGAAGGLVLMAGLVAVAFLDGSSSGPADER